VNLKPTKKVDEMIKDNRIQELEEYLEKNNSTDL